METPPSGRRYVPAPPPAGKDDAKKRLQLRLDLAKPTAFETESASDLAGLRIMTDAARAPFGESEKESHALVEAEALILESSLRAFQRELAMRERAVREQELRLLESESALMRRAVELADERIIIRKQQVVFEAGLSAVGDESNLRAMRELRDRIEESTVTLEEGREWLREREAFLEESERTLLAKMQLQQERECELEHREEEELRRRKTRFPAITPPAGP